MILWEMRRLGSSQSVWTSRWSGQNTIFSLQTQKMTGIMCLFVDEFFQMHGSLWTSARHEVLRLRETRLSRMST